MTLPQLPDDIIKSMDYVRSMSDWITMHKNPSISDLELAEKQINNSLAYLVEKAVHYQYMYETAKNDYEEAVENSFARWVDEEKATAAVAKIKSKMDCRELNHKMLEAKYLFKILDAFTDSRRSVVFSVIHMRETLASAPKTGL